MGRTIRRRISPRDRALLALGALLGPLLLIPAAPPAGLVRISDGAESFPVTAGDTLHPAPGWPVWLKDYTTSARGEGTSGLAFAGGDGRRGRCLLLADEAGFLRLCRVTQPGDTGAVALRLGPVTLDGSLDAQLAGHEVWDFEAVSLDRRFRQTPVQEAGRNAGGPGEAAVEYAADLFAACAADTLTGLLSVEARTEPADEQTRLLELRLIREPAPGGPRWRAATPAEAIPGAVIWNANVGAERGFKGLARSPGFLYAGLADLGFRGEVRIHGTLLFLYDRARGEIARIPTAPLGIYSIGGLEALSDSVTVVVDRSRQALSVIRWDAQRPGEIAACHRFFLDLPAPGGFRYGVPTVEGVTVDEAGGIWCVVDPWRGHYQVLDPAPPETLLIYMAAEMPMLYRFAGDRLWEQAGLGGLWAPPADAARGDE
jgi:hypothetical protein